MTVWHQDNVFRLQKCFNRRMREENNETFHAPKNLKNVPQVTTHVGVSSRCAMLYAVMHNNQHTTI